MKLPGGRPDEEGLVAASPPPQEHRPRIGLPHRSSHPPPTALCLLFPPKQPQRPTVANVSPAVSRVSDADYGAPIPRLEDRHVTNRVFTHVRSDAASRGRWAESRDSIYGPHRGSDGGGLRFVDGIEDLKGTGLDRTARMGVASDDMVMIEVAKRAGEPSVVTVNCPDQTGLGCDICRVILEFGLCITRGVSKLSSSDRVQSVLLPGLVLRYD
ncbi:hypothetical protein B296_00039813 [Ensete ventricosum]|uniref:ACT domain-containing protein n=1 Tax=Ensete ventricosum TaxID=4639 RepID=A0A426XGY2_ENSVE|nr:hypothetical protein B296_00039813 [Ensete ventricosum]